MVRTLGGKTIVQVSVARHSSGALSDRGEVFTWGSNRFGVLGLGDDIDRDEPTKIELGGGTGRMGKAAITAEAIRREAKTACVVHRG